ncbi:hypothetical protein JI76_01380 [Streptomyces anulatus]|nr:hypothetical protein JI76_01380 [Streptomyces anulatus]
MSGVGRLAEGGFGLFRTARFGQQDAQIDHGAAVSGIDRLAVEALGLFRTARSAIGPWPYGTPLRAAARPSMGLAHDA